MLESFPCLTPTLSTVIPLLHARHARERMCRFVRVPASASYPTIPLLARTEVEILTFHIVVFFFFWIVLDTAHENDTIALYGFNVPRL